MSAGESDAGRDGMAGRLKVLLPAGALLLVLAMAITIAGIAAAPLFRPGTWLILVAFLAMAAGGIAHVVAASRVA